MASPGSPGLPAQLLHLHLTSKDHLDKNLGFPPFQPLRHFQHKMLLHSRGFGLSFFVAPRKDLFRCLFVETPL